MAEEKTQADLRAERLAQLAAREAEDRARLGEDAALDLPVLEEFQALVAGDLTDTVARLNGIVANLVRRQTANGLALPFHLDQLGLVRGNLAAVAAALKTEAEGLIAASAAASAVAGEG